eukprot:m.27942 g.27942  ORF g.27942 m.27942 type:complete len:954 (-) comp10357_c1_seq2:207-3068(-)
MSMADCSASNFKVCVRIRPENDEEKAGEHKQVIQVLDEQMLVFDPKADNNPSFLGNARRRQPRILQRRARDVKFVFDQVFDQDTTQEQVFEMTTKPIIDGILEGYNASVFCYGATGAGKTHTMLGHGKAPGVIVLTVEELFQRIKERQDEISCNVAVSYLEVYNERIRDLLKPGSGELNLREDGKNGVVVSGLSIHEPRDATSLLKLLEKGNENRTQHPTDANATSSRSHAVFTVHVHQTPKGAGIKANVSVAKMMLIDLAGSERATATRNRGLRMREGANINKSLLALGNCINALASGKKKACHIPYRNSNLTRILKDTLGGNCRTVMIANCSPSNRSYEDTYNTLNYANRAKNIKVDLKKNVVNVDFHVTRYKKIMESLQTELNSVKLKLRKTQQALEDARKVKPPPSPAPALQEDVLSRGMRTLVPMFQTRRKIIQQITHAEGASREREADMRKARRESKRAEWLRHHNLLDVQAHIDRANADVVRSTEEKLKSDADLKVLGEKLMVNTRENAVWQESIEETVGSGLELRMLKYIYQCHAMQCENIGLKLRVEGLHNELRHEVKENARADRVITVLMKSCAKMRERLQDLGHNQDTELVETASNALNLALSGKEVAWPDRQSLDSKEELCVGTPEKLFTPIKALSAKRIPMRSINRTYSSQGNLEPQQNEEDGDQSRSPVPPQSEGRHTAPGTGRKSSKRPAKYMSDLSTPDRWTGAPKMQQEKDGTGKRFSSTPLAMPGSPQALPEMSSPDQSVIMDNATADERRKHRMEQLDEVRTSLDLTFDMANEDAKEDAQSHDTKGLQPQQEEPSDSSNSSDDNQLDTTQTMSPADMPGRTPSRPSLRSRAGEQEHGSKGRDQAASVVSKYQRMTALSTTGSKKLHIRSEQTRPLTLRNGDKQSRLRSKPRTSNAESDLDAAASRNKGLSSSLRNPIRSRSQTLSSTAQMPFWR